MKIPTSSNMAGLLPTVRLSEPVIYMFFFPPFINLAAMDIVVPAFLHHSMIIPFVQISKNEMIGSKNIHFILEIILIILKEEYMCKV